MPINFPNSPSPNQQYTYDNKTWEWNGTYWEVYSALTSYITSAYTVGNGYSDISGVTGGNIALKSFSGVNINIIDGGDKLTFSGYPQQNIVGVYLPLSGGTLTGGTVFQSGLTATTISATTITASTFATSFTTGSVIFQGSGGTLTQNNANFFWDNTNNRLGIGTSSPSTSLTVSGTNELLQIGDGSQANSSFISFNAARSQVGYKSNGLHLITSNSRNIVFGTGTFASTTEWARFALTTGNLLLGVITDSGFKLDVSGTTRIQGGLTATTVSATTYQNLPFSGTVTGGGTTNYIPKFTGTTAFGNSLIYDNGTNIGIGTVSPSAKVDVSITGGTVGFRLSGDSSSDMLRITQTGAGNAILVEDSTNPDSTPFVVDATGKVGIGTTSPNYFMEAITTGGVDAVMLFDGGTGANANLVARADTTQKLPVVVMSDRNNAYGVNTSFYIGLDRSPSSQYAGRNDSIYVNNYTDKGHHFVTANSGGTKAVRMSILGSGNVGIGTTSPLTTLDVRGATRLSASTGTSLTVISSGNSTSSPVFSVQGSQGELFSVTDSLTGSLFSVSDISGLPIMEVFSDSTTIIGDYQAPSLYTTKRVSSITATTGTTIYSFPTSAYTSSFVDYNVSGSTGLRAGNIMAIWSGSSVNFTETSTNDIGNTTPLTFGYVMSGSSAVLQASASTGTWIVKSIVRGL